MKSNMLSWLALNRSLLFTRLLQMSILAFMLGFNAIANVSLMLIFILWLVDSEIIDKLKHTFNNLYFWLFVSYLLITFLASFYSSDFSGGMKYVEMRLLLFMLPLIFAATKISKKYFDQVLIIFLMAVLLALGAGFFNSYLHYIHSGDTGFFYNDNLVSVVDKQATYFGLYINLSLVLCIYILRKLSISWKLKLLTVMCMVILIVGQMLLAVRAAILTMVIIGIAHLIFYSFNKNIKYGIGMLIAGLLVILSSFFILPQMTNRFKSMASNLEYDFENPNPVNHFNGEIKKENWNGLTLRLALWHCGIDIIKENPLFGTGTGDYDEAMAEQFKEKNFIYAREMNFGVHNQYLYSWISFGIIGILLHLTMIFAPMFDAFKRKNYLYIFFIIVIAFAMLTENTLNRYFGIYFYAVMNSFFFFLPKNYKTSY